MTGRCRTAAALLGILMLIPVMAACGAPDREGADGSPASAESREIHGEWEEASAMREQRGQSTGGQAARREGGVSAHGQLRLAGTRLVDADGAPIQLRGMSSHGLAWYPEYTSYDSILDTRERGANLFRIAMYTDQDQGYAYQPQESMDLLLEALDNVLAADMYAIVDWHTLRDNDPNIHRELAAEFFAEISRRYAGNPGILYEICNEPSGSTTWQDVKAYAMEIIPIIRANSPDAVILVGTPRYCVDIQKAAEDPLPFENVLYTYHLYTGNTDGGYKYAMPKAMEAGIGIFVSEWGISNEAHGEPDFEKAEEFLEFLGEHGISWASWSLCNKDEIYSAIRPDCDKLSGWEDSDLTDVGRYIFGALAG